MDANSHSLKHKNWESLIERAYELRDTAKALSRVGNTALAHELYDVANEIERTTHELRKLDSDDIAAYVKMSFESSNNMFRACCAGAALHAPKDAVQSLTKMALGKDGDAQ